MGRCHYKLGLSQLLRSLPNLLYLGAWSLVFNSILGWICPAMARLLLVSLLRSGSRRWTVQARVRCWIDPPATGSIHELSVYELLADPAGARLLYRLGEWDHLLSVYGSRYDLLR